MVVGALACAEEFALKFDLWLRLYWPDVDREQLQGAVVWGSAMPVRFLTRLEKDTLPVTRASRQVAPITKRRQASVPRPRNPIGGFSRVGPEPRSFLTKPEARGSALCIMTSFGFIKAVRVSKARFASVP